MWKVECQAFSCELANLWHLQVVKSEKRQNGIWYYLIHYPVSLPSCQNDCLVYIDIDAPMSHKREQLFT